MSEPTSTPSSPSPASRCPSCGAAIADDAPLVDGRPVCPGCLLGAGLPTGGRAADLPSAAEIAERFPDYEILGLLGRGGMGVVWKARHKGLDRLVALKVLPKDVATVPGFAERFQREARALARLTHPNIVGVHEFGDRGGAYFLILEYVDGVNVRQAMREGRIAPGEVLRIVPQICDALQYAHEHGVVHRDIKPENVLLDREGRVKVADFGLAKIVGADGGRPELTVTGQVMGTVHYMAPEQFEKPTTVDHRADIYSLGVVFYEMLTGELPLGRFPPPSQKFHLDVRLDEVVLRSLEKEPGRRWQHAVDVKSEVGTIERSPRAAAGVAALPATPTAAPRVNRLAVAALLAVLFAALAAVVAGTVGTAIWLLVLVCGGLLLGAFVAGIVSWVQIVRSRGSQSGLGYAIAATMLSILAPCLVAPLAYVVPTRQQAKAAEEAVARAAANRRARGLAGVDHATRGDWPQPGIDAVARLKALPQRDAASVAALYARGEVDTLLFQLLQQTEQPSPAAVLTSRGLPLLTLTWPAERLAKLVVTTHVHRSTTDIILNDVNQWSVTAVEGGNAYTFDVVVEAGEPKFRATPVVVTPK